MQMCVVTLKQIRCFVVLLALAMMGFGTALYLLFRSDAVGDGAAPIDPKGKAIVL